MATAQRSKNTMGGTRPRNDHDFYATPQRLADAICARLRETIEDVDLVIEPSAGDGAFAASAATAWPSAKLALVEPNGGRCFDRDRTYGWQIGSKVRWEDPQTLIVEEIDRCPRTLIVGNPPFAHAESHVRIALDRLGHGRTPDGEPTDRHWPRPRWLAFLLRASFLAGGARSRELHLGVGGLRHVWHVVGRPSFTGDGKSDGAEYAVCVWQAGWHGPYAGGWLTWTK